MFEFSGDIVAKPRMNQSDKWKNRKVVNRYWAFKDLLTLEANKQSFVLGDAIDIVCYIQMPKSWSKNKKEIMKGKPHKQKPDGDNILKSIQDILRKEDSGIWKFHFEKYWSEHSSGLIIKNIS